MSSLQRDDFIFPFPNLPVFYFFHWVLGAAVRMQLKQSIELGANHFDWAMMLGEYTRSFNIDYNVDVGLVDANHYLVEASVLSSLLPFPLPPSLYSFLFLGLFSFEVMNSCWILSDTSDV